MIKNIVITFLILFVISLIVFSLTQNIQIEMYKKRSELAEMEIELIKKELETTNQKLDSINRTARNNQELTIGE